MRDLVHAMQLETRLREVVGISEQDAVTLDACAREILKLRALNPHCVQAALLLLMGTFLAVGDTRTGISASDLQAKLDRMIAIQKELQAMLEQERESMVEAVLDHLGFGAEDGEDRPLDKAKIN